MVEAIVVIPTLLIIFAGLVFIWRLYSQKINVMSTARLAAWAYAGSNCGQPGDPGPEDVASIPGASGQTTAGMGNGNNGGTAAENAQAQQVLRNTPSDVHADTMTRDLDTGAASAQGTVIPSPFLGFEGPVSVTATVSVMCNEPPYNASLVDMIKAAFYNLR